VRDEELMRKIVEYLDCGRIESDPRGGAVNFTVTKITDITDKIIPFFNKYPFNGSKYLDFQDLAKAAILIKGKNHLSPEGLKKNSGYKKGYEQMEIVSL
jgi:hypothetical protein